MREATGELNMTVVTVVAIAAVAGLFYAFVWPSIQSAIRNQSCSAITDSTGKSYTSFRTNQTDANGKTIWVCCDSKVAKGATVTLNPTTKEPTNAYAGHCTSGAVN